MLVPRTFQTPFQPQILTNKKQVLVFFIFFGISPLPGSGQYLTYTLSQFRCKIQFSLGPALLFCVNPMWVNRAAFLASGGRFLIDLRLRW